MIRKKIKRHIVLTALLAILTNNCIFGQIIKLETIYVQLVYEVMDNDTIYYPYNIGYVMSVYNDDVHNFHLLFGACLYNPREKYINGVFRVSIKGQKIDLLNRMDKISIVLHGDSLPIISELYNKILVSMAFKKEYLEEFMLSMKNIKITYHPIVKDYPTNIIGTYFIKQDYEVIIDNPYVIIENQWIMDKK